MAPPSVEVTNFELAYIRALTNRAGPVPVVQVTPSEELALTFEELESRTTYVPFP